MASKAVIAIAQAGVVATTLSAVAASDSILAVGNKQDVFYAVKNGSGGSINATVKLRTGLTSKNVPGIGPVTLADKVVAVANGATTFIGPFTEDYIQSDGSVTIEHSGTSSVTGDAFRCAPVDRPS